MAADPIKAIAKTMEGPSEYEDAVIAFIEETGGDIDFDAVKAKLKTSEGSFMQVVERACCNGAYWSKNL